MWDYIENGTIDTVGSDHAPYTVEEKERNPQDIFLAPAGFPGLETRFGLMMKAVADGRISLRRAVELIATNPAKAYGLYPRKGAIKIGADADFILCDPKAEYMVEKTGCRRWQKISQRFSMAGSSMESSAKLSCVVRSYMRMGR